MEKLHAAVARSTFSSKNVQNMSGLDEEDGTSGTFILFRLESVVNLIATTHVCPER